MTKEDLIRCFRFSDKSEESDATFYIKMKGISFHKKIMIHLGYEFNGNSETIDWKKVSSLLRYDKRLREKIYIYLATFEEYIRSYISNKYEDYKSQEFWLATSLRKKSIKEKIESGILVSEVLEETEFGELILQVKQLPLEDKELIFEITDFLDENLEAVRVLRNAVSHHCLLHEYKFKKCRVDNIESDSLEHNIKNLRQLLPQEYRYGKSGDGGITKDIERCKYYYENKDNNEKKKEKLLIIDKKDIIIL